ncbi:MAG: hypothetical protein ACW99U_18280 [Candidatus Thorarchaeota archaeon]|jgi:hypothetical protein
MATLTSLRPNGDNDVAHARLEWTNVGGDTACFEAIDDDPDSPDSLDYAENDATETDTYAKFELSAVDADFGSMDSLQVDAFMTTSGSRSNDDIVMSAQVFADDEVTTYTDKVVFATWDATPETGKVSQGFTLTGDGSSANKAAWDLAVFRIDWDYQKTGSGDNMQYRVDAIELNGAYTAQATSLTVQSGGHSHEGAGATFAQVHSFSVQSGDHSHEGAPLTLAQVHSFAVGSGNHAHEGAGVIFAQATPLTVQQATHAHAADPLAFVQYHNLAVGAGGHAHEGAVATLTQQTEFMVQSVLHSHEGAGVTFVQVHSLAIGAIAHTHLGENVEFTENAGNGASDDKTLFYRAIRL